MLHKESVLFVETERPEVAVEPVMVVPVGTAEGQPSLLLSRLCRQVPEMNIGESLGLFVLEVVKEGKRDK